MTKKILIDRDSFLFSVIGEPALRSRSYLVYLETKCSSKNINYYLEKEDGVPKTDEDRSEAVKALELLIEIGALLRCNR